ncbi:MAG TPA: MAC/perforin domain-containing protein, partial [Saprospiraceae bacterium]|nr:MAC/perforin domain-containing protein [Saprospiraceae bacterium]
GPFTYLERLPEGNKLKGYSAELVDRKLVGINFYSNLSNILSPQSIGLFTSSDFGQPTRADEIARKQDDRYFDPRDNKLHLHGNYTTPEIYKIFYNSHDQSYSIIGENLPNKTTKNYLTRISPKSTYHWGKNNGNVWEGEGANMVKLDETTFYGINKSNTSTPYIPLITLKRRSRIKTAKPAPSSNDKIQWGGTFSFDQRPPQLQYNFMGYNIAKMDYQNYQLNTGVTNMVFQLPDENSTDYYFSTNGKILPHGIIFKNDREAFNKARSHLVSTEKEHLEAWNMNLGFSIGVPEAMSFGLNYSHKESVDKMRSTHKTHGLSISSEILYALVLDKTNIPLNEEFKQMIFHIRDQYLIYGNGTTPASGADLFEEQTTNATKPKNYIMFSWYNWLLENYGTHYPYAVSYGGSAYQEFELSNKRTKVTKEQGYEISGKISASAEEVQGGLDGGGGSSSKDVDDDGVEDKISNIRTIGGTLSTGTEGGNWSLPDHSEVPVLLDLRPLYELLSPVFFDDPIIYTVLRKGLVDALKRYEEKFQISEESWEYKPKEYEFSFDNIYVSNRRGKQVNLMGALRANTVDFVDPQKTQITFLPDQISKDNPSYNMFEFANNFSTRDAYKSIFAIEQLNKKMSFSVVQDEFCETGIEISAELLESPLTAEEFDYFMKASDMEKTAFLLKKGWEFGLTEFMNFFSRESNDLNQKYTQSKIIRLKDIKPGSTYNDVISFKKNGFEISFFFKIEQVNVDNTNSWNIPCKSNR